MLPCFAIRLRSVVFSILLMGFVVSPIHPILQAQSGAVPAFQPVKQADPVAADPDFGPLTRLDQQLPVWVKAENQAAGHTVDLSAAMHASLLLSRSPAAETAFQQLLVNQQNPSSSMYHRWLTPQQVGTLFGPTQNDLAAVSSWLTSQGLNLNSISPSGLVVQVSGTAAVLSNAFHINFGHFSVGGRARLSAMSAPSIPTALTPLIRSVHGLTETHYEPQSKFSLQELPARGPKPQADLGNNTFAILPSDFDVIYDSASVISGGDTGATIGSKAQHIAIIDRSRVVAADISNYETLSALPSVQPNVVLAGTDPGVATGTNIGDASEATLDVDRVIGTAPGAQADLVLSADNSTEDGIDIAIAYNINTLLDPIMTISFGSCEAENGLSETNFLNSEFETAAGEGISTFISAGDAGAAGCDTPFVAVTASDTPQIASINALCSSSYVTCVGGTEFNDASDYSLYWSSTNNSSNGNESALSYIPEGAWNEPSSTTNGVTTYAPAAGGGGVSAYIAKPSWQTGTGVPADGFRDVPDVSFSAADHDGYVGCFAAGGGGCVATSSTSGTPIVIFSGTSATAPSMAGITALLNTKLGSAQGNINPLLYRLAALDPAVFHDVTVASSGVSNCTSATPSTCNNSTSGPTGLTGGLAGYVVTTGYDQATGLGSVDVANLLTSATSTGGSGSGTPSFTLAANPTSLSVTPVLNTTSTGTIAITGTSVNGFAGAVALSCVIMPAASQPPTCAVSPSSVSLAASGTASSTLTITYQGSYSCGYIPPSSQTAALRGASAAMLAGLLLLVMPIRKRRSLRALGMVCLIAGGLASLSGCSGSKPTTPPVCNVISAPTTAGTYTVTVTGTSGSLSATAPVTLTLNN